MRRAKHDTENLSPASLKLHGHDPLPEKDERIVWQHFIEGDDQSLIFIYRKYADLLYRYGQQFSLRYEFVQDCIQELFFDLINKRRNLSGARSIKAYLFSSLKRAILRNIKKEERLQFEEEGFNFSYSEQPISITRDLEEQDFEVIYKKINQLPASQREVIFLYFYEGLGYAEIAEIMNVKIASARTLTYRALENLERELGPFMRSLVAAVPLIASLFTCQVISSV